MGLRLPETWCFSRFMYGREVNMKFGCRELTRYTMCLPCPVQCNQIEYLHGSLGGILHNLF